MKRSKHAQRKRERYGHIPMALRNEDIDYDQFFRRQLKDIKRLIYRKPRDQPSARYQTPSRKPLKTRII